MSSVGKSDEDVLQVVLQCERAVLLPRSRRDLPCAWETTSEKMRTRCTSQPVESVNGFSVFCGRHLDTLRK